ncbi:DptB.2 family protein [Megaselia abdita]
MSFKSLIVLCFLAVVVAIQAGDVKINIPPPTQRPFEIHGQGGGNDRNTGFGGSIDGKVQAWKSDNGKHSIDVTGGASKYGIGSKWGSSPTDRRVGGQYTYRW